MKNNIAVFASGRGSNFSAIVRAIKKGALKANLALLISDNPKAAVLGRAKRAGVKAVLVNSKDYTGKKDFEAKIIQHLESENIELIVLAGFMRLLSPEFVRRYKGRILNIHPSLLPSFKGTQGIIDAFNYGAKVTGVTVHFVDEELDHGPIILQAPVKIEDSDSLESLEAKVHKIEHALYPQAIQLVLEGKLEPAVRRIRITAR